MQTWLKTLSLTTALTSALIFTWSPAAPTAAQPADDPADDIFTGVIAEESGSPVAVEANVRVFFRNGKPSPSHRLAYQFRLYSNDGEPGRLLGNPEFPKGRAYFTDATGEPQANGVAYLKTIDVTRLQLSQMTNLPEVPQDSSFFLAIEAHAFDTGTNEFLTPPTTSPLIIVGGISRTGQVYRVEHFAEWFAYTAEQPGTRALALRIFQSFEPRIAVYNHRLMPEYEALLEADDIDAAGKADLLKAMPAKWLGEKNNLPRIVERLAQSADPAVAQAAQAKVRAFNTGFGG